MQIFDCFSFHDELDLLEIRLKRLWGEIDYFVLVEGDRTYEGVKKPSIYLQNRARFAWAASKIIHVQESLEATPASRWQNEDILRRTYLRGIETAKPDDMIALSCIEDLFSIQLLRDLKRGMVSSPALVVLDCYRYFLNGKVLGPLSYWPYPVLAKRSQIGTDIADLERRFSYRAVKDGGWHFSELNKNNENDILFKLLERNRIKYVEIGDNFPSYLREHQNQFKHLIRPVDFESHDQKMRSLQGEFDATALSNEIYYFRHLELNRTVSRLQKQLSSSTQGHLAVKQSLEETIESERKVFYDLRGKADKMIQQISFLDQRVNELTQRVNEFENSKFIQARNRLRRWKEKFTPSR